jgi:hypothetical protein
MHLAASFAGKNKTQFLDLRIKSYGCLKFQREVWAEQACAAANEKELTPCAKSGGQEEEKNSTKMGPGLDRWSPASRRPAVAHRPRVDAWTCWAVPIFLKFFNFKKMNFWKFEKWARAFGRMGVQRPHFLKLPLTLGSANSSKIHGEWRFHFFPNFLFPKFSSYLDLHIYSWDFCFMKKLIP